VIIFGGSKNKKGPPRRHPTKNRTHKK